MCDRQDIGISIGSGAEGDNPDLTRTGEPVTLADEPRIFIYDNYPGGIGFSQPLFAMHADLMSRTRTMIAGCECERGCPSCVGPVGDIGPLAKLVALRILDLLARPARPAPPGQALVDGGPAPGWGEHPVALDGGVF
jgi:DEAD/DEAH box helicase domain-containing protein